MNKVFSCEFKQKRIILTRPAVGNFAGRVPDWIISISGRVPGGCPILNAQNRRVPLHPRHPCRRDGGPGGPTVFKDLTDSPENQHVFLSLLQNLKSKISEKSGQNWSCNKLKTNSISQTQLAGQKWWLSIQEGQNCCKFSFSQIFLIFWF